MRVFLITSLMLVFLWSGSEGQSLKGIKIYINPGHGGYDSDDRNVAAPPYSLGNTDGFWESKSNLVKGLYLKKLLESAGAGVIISREQNRTVDDRPLSAIAEEANANGVDFMISIHSNAYDSKSNFPLMLFHGWDNAPIRQQSLDLANFFWDDLFSNQITLWTYQKPNVRGDKSFAPASWNGYGVLRPLTVPGLISEGSFHDYLPETCRLLNDDYKKLEAWHHFRAFCRYYGGNPGKKGKIAGFVKDSVTYVSLYSYIAGTKDQWMPVNGARITLNPGNLSYTTDSQNNGFFIFDGLEPGSYRLRIEADRYATVNTMELKVDSAKVTYFSGYLKSRELSGREIPLTGNGDSEVKIYPNPATTVLIISRKGEPGISTYTITDLSGRNIRTGSIQETANPAELSVADLKQGAYILNISSKDGSNHSIFIKQ